MDLQEEENTDESDESLKLSDSVIGRETITALQDVKARLVTPSWLTTLPTSLGDGKLGKLTADQWRIFITVHFPLATLYRWGAKGGR